MIEEIIWDEGYLIAFEEIDMQHKHLCLIINKLIKKANSHSPNTNYDNLFKKLISYTKWHFSCEESLMEILHHEKYAEHKEEHDVLINTLSEKLEQVKSDKTAIHELQEFLFGWFGGHSFGYDMELGNFANSVWKP